MSLVDLNVEEPGWEVVDLAAIAEQSARAALALRGLDPDSFEISLLGCDDDRIAGLNADFRGKPQPTNVLSWPAFELRPDAPGGDPLMPPEPLAGMPLPLGDVAIALQTTQAEAEARQIPLKNHVSHLILHGCMHLLGYDHETDEDADLMEGLEVEALSRLGIDNPYR
ncbi:rRNA maturation RNase YbeY [Rhodobacteraceae bacterium NNCM2]|nr:rRNA maturation RNase YbeY [Coraliihabitans acroporae]